MKKIITSFFILSCLIAGPVSAALSPNDPFYQNQWYLHRIAAEKAWSKAASSPHTIIAVIDSGIQIDHPDLKDNIWRNQAEIAEDGKDNDGNGFIDDIYGWDFTDNTNDPNPKLKDGWTKMGISHGTLVAGIIAASGNNKKGVAGLTWKAQIMPLKALNDKGEGRTSDVIRAIDYAILNGAHIINLSFSTLNYSEGLQEAIYRAHRAGIMIVAAAGNEQASGQGYNIDETKLYPVCYDGKLIGENMVIGVAATDALDQKTSFSSYGSTCVDISAPGISFFNTVTNKGVVEADKYYDGYFSGTSLAAPLVSATLALISEANPELSRREIVNILLASTDKIDALNPDYAGLLGNGRLNVDKAISMAKENLYKQVSRLVIVPTGEGEVPRLTAVNGDLVFRLEDDIFNFQADFSAFDIEGDGDQELIVGATSGQEPKVSIYDASGKFKFSFLAFEKNYRGGVNVTVADLDDDGKGEIIVAPQKGRLAEVRIFNSRGNLQKSFLAVDSNWQGGVQVAAGNIDGQGELEIVVALQAGAEPQLRIFSASGKLQGIFLAYEKDFRGGVNLTVSNIDGRIDRNKAEIIVSPGPGRKAEVKIFTNRGVVKKSFQAYNNNWLRGAYIASGDLNNDGVNDIILSAYSGGAPHVRGFDASGNLLESFYAYSEDFIKGVKAGIIKINN
ncbi:hypothetical protein EOL99_01940 [Candidatus Falkowbacteria bacterium]|nr:hypothetical protein [Candidatus Falkowbacteria bacterium]